LVNREQMGNQGTIDNNNIDFDENLIIK
jgi:hypothetical protein